MKRTVRVVAVIGLASALFGGGAIGVVRQIRSERPVALSGEALWALRSGPVIAPASLADLISALQQRLRSDGDDWRSHAQLGMAYIQQARVTGDSALYVKAEAVLERSLQLRGESNFEAFLGMASLAAARHHFSDSMTWAERAVTVDPHSADARAALGDAQAELGRYDQAFTTYQRMVDLRPGLPTYARVSYAWELQGSYPNAVRAMDLALRSAGSPVDAAWASAQLGDLHFNAGQVEKAAGLYRRALAIDGSFVPALAGLAKVDAATGTLHRAIRRLRRVVERYPSPEYVIALGDVYAMSRRHELAAQQYALVEVQERLLRANGVNVDLELSLFHADHHVDVDEALAAARAEWASRQSIHVADTLAWTLFANGRYQEAIGYSEQALRLGTENGLFYFHRGMIERALGRNGAARRDLARALDINPHFSTLWSADAARFLRLLGRAR